MKRFVAFSLLVSLSLATHAQEGGVSEADRKIEIKNKVEVDAADRAAVAKGVSEVGRGMQGFFQALNGALAQAHRDRAGTKATKSQTPPVKDVDKPSSPR